MSLKSKLDGPLPVTAPLVLKVYRDLADGFGANADVSTEWPQLEKEMLAVIGLEKLLEIERATVETGTRSVAAGLRALDHL